jgi:hypothetical protein
MERFDRRAHAKGTREGPTPGDIFSREWKRSAALVDTFAFHYTTTTYKALFVFVVLLV